MRPSSLDGLDAAAIPPHERVAGQPPELVAVLGTHRGAAWEGLADVVWSPDGKWIASRSYSLFSGVVRVWRAEGLQDQGCWRYEVDTGPMVFSPDGRLFAFADGMFHRKIRLCDLSGEQPAEWVTLVDVVTNPEEPPPLSELSAPPVFISALAFSPDGRKLAVAGDNGVVRVWGLDGPQPEEIAALPAPSAYS
jgi:WD40 repeat protein